MARNDLVRVQEMTWSARGTGGGNASPPGGPGRTWPRGRIVLAGQSQGGEAGGPRPPLPDGDQDGRASANYRSGPLLTGRGALLGMLVLFFLGILVAAWLDWSPLADASFVLGCGAAAWWTKPRDLLTVVVSPPVLFFGALLGIKALTATGDTLVSIAGGTALTLASAAPWLLAGVAISLIMAWFRGLPRCVSDLRRETRGDLQPDRARPAVSSRPAGHTRRGPGAGEGR
jgi:hypothetical protein